MFRATGAALASLFLLGSSVPSAQEPPTTIVSPEDARAHGLDSLFLRVREEGVPGPTAPGILRNPPSAVRMGKALFWEMGVGSDGVQACATCHFHAGADSRARNQVSPGLARAAGARDGDVRGFAHAAAAGDTTFEVSPPNTALTLADFPFVRDIGNGANVLSVGGVLEPAAGNANDVASSQGVKLTDFVGVVPGALEDIGVPRLDPVFRANGKSTRRVEPRNTPTVINAVFNFFNFWDGRANPFFNGASPFGAQDPSARVFEAVGDTLVARKLELELASLASQAVGPPRSHFEMSFGDGAGNGRSFPEIGRKLLALQALSQQEVAADDSMLANLRHPSGFGLNRSYAEFVRAAFEPRWWNSKKLVFFPPAGDPQVIDPSQVTDPARTFTLMEANFAFFYGAAVMAYERTLVSHRSPFDRWMEASGGFVPGFGPLELAGLNVFANEGKCINCHGGPEFTNASVRNAQRGGNVLEPMLMGDRRPALYDNGFYNIGVTPTLDDLGRGGSDPLGRPLSSSRQVLFEALGIQNMPFDIIGSPRDDLVSGGGDLLGVTDEDTGDFIPVCHDLDGDGRCGEADDFVLRRVAVDGAFKTPSLRNVALTGPYFHNGSMATLMEVVEFYDRGGNFCRLNRADLDPDIQPLGLTAEQRHALVAFLLALTDPRVARESEPFDRPGIRLPNGSFFDGTDAFIELSAVGRTGRPAGQTLRPFLNADPFGANPVLGNTDATGRVACSPDFPIPE
jgi:cytochrome c peroxidase